uniref:Uncharacterized protein n=1 Tax=Cyanothece sp. (strain PCC 7425 / ATCC 29141) TaxID=395961 RepID=B8HQD8_CYAP4
MKLDYLDRDPQPNSLLTRLLYLVQLLFQQHLKAYLCCSLEELAS